MCNHDPEKVAGAVIGRLLICACECGERWLFEEIISPEREAEEERRRKYTPKMKPKQAS